MVQKNFEQEETEITEKGQGRPGNVARLMLQIVIREYQTSDWPEICRIHDLARPIEVAAFIPKAEVLPMERVAAIDGFLDSQTWVACVDHAEGKVTGFVSIRLPELTWSYVDPSLRRRGIGRKLVNHVLPRLGADGFVLCAGENPQAVAFYQSLGFVISARFPGEAQGYRCECVRLTMPCSKFRSRPPVPAITALRLAGFTENSPGKAFLDEHGVYRWR